jgi:hypothetical protein
MGQAQNQSIISRRQSMNLSNSGVTEQGSESARYFEKDLPKLPNAQVNQDKLKVILQQLKKIDRNSVHSSK